MSKQLGPIEITCDSPPYTVVQACRLVGFDDPEDVRWFRLSAFLAEHAGWGEVAHMLSWSILPANKSLDSVRCTCGQPLPRMQRCLFSTSTGKSFTHLLGQCERCRTMYWEDEGSGMD